jgi:hypothetical protein
VWRKTRCATTGSASALLRRDKTVALRQSSGCCARSNPVKLGQTDDASQIGGQIVCKYFNMNDLQNNRLSMPSKSVKLNQTDCDGLITPKKSNLIQVNPTKSN